MINFITLCFESLGRPCKNDDLPRHMYLFYINHQALKMTFGIIIPLLDLLGYLPCMASSSQQCSWESSSLQTKQK